MSHRLFEGKTHAELYLKHRRKDPNGLIPTIIAFLNAKYDGKMKLALDVGCGSGQCTLSLAKYFDKVIGTDVSESQIEFAKLAHAKTPNVQFLASPAETLPFEDGSCQLITAAQAFHWFNIPKFYEEANRLLCPGGVMAIFSYMYPTVEEFDYDIMKGKKLQTAFEKFWREDLDGYWSDRIRIPHNKYKDISIPKPFVDFTRYDQDQFYEDRIVPLEGLINLIRTWSAFQNFVSVNGVAEGEILIKKFLKRAASIIGEENNNYAHPERVMIRERMCTAMIIARKPYNTWKATGNRLSFD